MATNLTIDEVTQNVTLIVSNERGPVGPAGPNSVTSATTSDGTANLSLAAATVTGTLTANHIHGNLAGSIYLHVRAGEALSKGDPVYVSGSHGTGSAMVPIVMRADASNAAKMPAIAIMDAAVANNGDGHAVINGTIADLDTSAYAVNSTLYVANGGGMTATKPANAQPVARVERSNLNNGGIVVKVNGLYSDVTIASSQVTDATSAATAGTIVKRNGGGSAAFGSVTAITTDVSANPSTITLGGPSEFLNILTDGETTPNAYFQCNASTASATTYTFPDATGAVILDSTLGAGVNGLSTITGAKSFSGQVQLTGQAATDDNSAMTRGLADARYFNKLRSLFIGFDSGWVSVNTPGGSITGIQGNLRIEGGNGTSAGASTAFISNGRWGVGVSPAGNFSGIDFSNPVAANFSFRTRNFNIASSLDWAFLFGSVEPTTAGMSNMVKAGSAASIGWVGIRCVSGNVTIIAVNGTSTVGESSTIDTCINGHNQKGYRIVVDSGQVQCFNSSGLLLGTLSTNVPTAKKDFPSPVVLVDSSSNAIQIGIIVQHISFDW